MFDGDINTVWEAIFLIWLIITGAASVKFLIR